MTYFIKDGNKFRQTPTSAVDIKSELPVGTYTVGMDKMGFYYDRVDDMSLPPKLYGDTTRHAERIINTFNSRSSSTGVFLDGEKGSGKTLLAKAISLQMLPQDVPTLLINQPLFGPEFNTLIQQMTQDAVIIFDEFEKVYDDEQQPHILTLLDGVFNSKKLFIITCNDSYKVDSHLKNRPGRLFYHLKFDGLTADFVEEYARENLKDKSQVEGLLLQTNMFSKINFDMLKAIVEEMNRYDEPADKSLEMLNCKPSTQYSKFKVELTTHDGAEKDNKRAQINDWHGNPLEQEIQFSFYNDEATKIHQYYFNVGDLTAINGMDGIYEFENEAGDKLKLSKPNVRKNKFNLGSFLVADEEDRY